MRPNDAAKSGATKNFPCIFPCYSATSREKFDQMYRPVTNSDLQFAAEVEVSDLETETDGRSARNFPDLGVSVAHRETEHGEIAPECGDFGMRI